MLNRQGTRALVVGVDDTVARIELASGRVERAATRAAARSAKRLLGSSRTVAWLDERRLLVAGWGHALDESTELAPRTLDVTTWTWSELAPGFRAPAVARAQELFAARKVSEVQQTARSAAVLFASRHGVDGVVVDLASGRTIRSLRGRPYLRLLLERSSPAG